MSETLFRDSFIVYRQGLRTKAWVLPLSIAAHAAIIALLVVIPLMQASNLPTIEITSAFLAPPPPPPPAKKAGKSEAKRIKPVQAQTDMYGRVRDVKILRSIPLLDQAAIDAVRQWVYEPMIINGRPRGVIFSVTVTFQLK